MILDDGKPAVELSFRFELDWGPDAGRKLEYTDTGKPLEIDFKPGGIAAVNPATGNGMTATLHTQPYLLCGHLDRVVSFHDDLYVMDRKTSISTLGTYWFDQWTPSNQMTLYALAGKIMLNQPIKGVIIDAAQVLLEKPNQFVRGFAYRTEDQLAEWLSDLRYFLREAEDYATAGYWPQNDTACTKYGGCPFREVCSKAPAVRETYLAARFDKLNRLEQAANPFYERS